VIDEMGLPSYLDGNSLSRKMAWGKLRVVISAGDFSLQDIVLDYGCGAGILFSTIANNVKEILATATMARQVVDRLLSHFGSTFPTSDCQTASLTRSSVHDSLNDR